MPICGKLFGRSARPVVSAFLNPERERRFSSDDPWFLTRRESPATSGSALSSQRLLEWPKRWQPKPALEGKIDPIHQRRLQFGHCFLFGRSRCDQAAKAGDSGGIALIGSERSDLGEFQRLLAVSV